MHTDGAKAADTRRSSTCCLTFLTIIDVRLLLGHWHK